MPSWNNKILKFTIINSPLINFPNYAQPHSYCISEQLAGKRKTRRRKRGRRERRRKGDERITHILSSPEAVPMKRTFLLESKVMHDGPSGNPWVQCWMERKNKNNA